MKRTKLFTALAMALSGLLAAGGVATLWPGQVWARRLAMTACAVMVASALADGSGRGATYRVDVPGGRHVG